MARLNVPELPEWTFGADEESAGVYRVEAVHSPSGLSVEARGTDLEVLIDRCKVDAVELLARAKEKLGPEAGAGDGPGAARVDP
ncbi:hypothetical protein GCM10009547_48100 [Sporichthya brevicatena]|uniref:Uncharacterized protein n=1 Tax=Sporichthya brevicatena TaxID=171442 RepID=A0ABN1HCM8_9ACTN